MFEMRFIGLDQLRDRFRKAPEIVRDEMTMAVNELTLTGEGLAKGFVGTDTHFLQRSITHQAARFAGGEVVGSFGTNATYAGDHELGTPPGRMVPVAELEGWAKRHGMPARLVQWAIFTKGTKPREYMANARRELEPKVRARFLLVAERIASRLGE